MMRLNRLFWLRRMAAAGKPYHWPRGCGALRAWLFKHGLIAGTPWECVVTDKGMASLRQAEAEYGERCRRLHSDCHGNCHYTHGVRQ